MYPKDSRRILVIGALVAAAAAGAMAATITVPGMVPTIQDAIDMATSGDEICVDPGTYDEILVIVGKSITVRSTGGAATTVVDAGGAFSALTLIDADDTAIEGFTITGGAGTDGGGIDVSSSDGVAIRDCAVVANAAVGVLGTGGGIHLEDSDGVLIEGTEIAFNSAIRGGGLGSDGSSFLLTGSSVIDNDAGADGGGIYVATLFGGGLAPEIEGTTVAGNAAGGDGGGIAALSAFPLLTTVELRDNTADGDGGGLFSSGGGTVLVLESVIAGNSATIGGGALVDDHDLSAFFRNTLIADNVATAQGGGIFMRDVNDGGLGTPGVLVNATLSNNSAGSGGGGLYAVDSRVAILNGILWGNAGSPGSQLVCQAVAFADSEVSLDFSDLEGGGFAELGGADCVLGIGNLDVDPLFVAPAMGDYHLGPASPLIDAGVDTALAGPFDVDGDSRMIGTTDIGADEVCPWVKGDTNGDGGVDIADMTFVLAFLFQSGVAPVPLARADVNGDGSVGLADVVYLGAYLFQNGPDPLCRP